MIKIDEKIEAKMVGMIEAKIDGMIDAIDSWEMKVMASFEQNGDISAG